MDGAHPQYLGLSPPVVNVTPGHIIHIISLRILTWCCSMPTYLQGQTQSITDSLIYQRINYCQKLIRVAAIDRLTIYLPSISFLHVHCPALPQPVGSLGEINSPWWWNWHFGLRLYFSLYKRLFSIIIIWSLLNYMGDNGHHHHLLVLFFSSHHIITP